MRKFKETGSNYTREQKFWARVEKGLPDDCWPWMGTRDHRGYGVFYTEGRNRRATRISWEIANSRPFPEDKDACHTCDNPSCVNPSHLWPGTASENALDMVAKGRNYVPTIKYNSLKTNCPQGHPFAGANLRVDKRGNRICVICQRANNKRWKDNRNAKRRLNAIVCEDAHGQS